MKPSKPLQVHEDPQRGVFISELSYHQPDGADHLLEMLQQGNSNRTQHPTDCNSESSRSHAVFQVHIQQRDRTADLSSVVRVAKMSMIDLAGSERAKATSGQIARFREGANINKSLLALGNCINALAARKNKSSYIPYRNSKLTRILKDSLGGNCQTVMIAAISSASSSYDDTYNTLKYADRAKSIQINLKSNTVNVDAHVSKYAKIVEDLRTEVTELKKKLHIYESNQNNADIRSEIPDDNQLSAEIEKYCYKIRDIFEERKKLKKTLLEFDSSLHQLQVKMHWRRIGTERMSLLSSDQNEISKSVSKTDAAVRSLVGREQHIKDRREETQNQMESNDKVLEECKAELHEIWKAGNIPKIIEDCLQHCQLQLEKEELSLQLKHSREVALLQERECLKHERTFRRLLSLVRQEHLLLTCHHHLTQELQGEYDAVLREVTGLKEVAWADEVRVADRFKSVTVPDSVSKDDELVHKVHLTAERINGIEPPGLSDASNALTHPILKRSREDGGFETNKRKRCVKRLLSETYCAHSPQPEDGGVESLPATPVLYVPHSSCSDTFIASPFHCVQNETFVTSPGVQINCNFTPPAFQRCNVSPFTNCLSSCHRAALSDVQNTPISAQRKWIKSPKSSGQDTPNLKNASVGHSFITSKGAFRRNKSLSHAKSESGKEVSTGYHILDKVYQRNYKVNFESLRVPNSANKSSNVSSVRATNRWHRKSLSENKAPICPSLGEKKNRKLFQSTFPRKQQIQRMPSVSRFRIPGKTIAN